MPAKADDPLRKVTLNLYEADCAAMEQLHGHGWSTQVRQLIHEYCATVKLQGVTTSTGIDDFADWIIKEGA